MNGFKNVGIVEAVKKAREGSPSDGNPPPPEEDEDPFHSYSEAEDA